MLSGVTDVDDTFGPIDSPAAWRGDELAASPAWRRALTVAEIAALERATAGARGAPLPGFGAAAFPVPELEPLFAWMIEQLERGPGVVRLTGLPAASMARDDLKRLFWGFCVNLGMPVYQTAAGEVLGEVKDETGTGAALTYDGPGPLKSARTIARSTGALRFHTDKTDMLCLLCATNAIEGGVSKVVSSVTLHNEIRRRRPDLLRVLYEPYWRMRPTDEEGDRDDRVFPMPVFARAADGSFSSQYSRTYISQAQEVPEVPRLTAMQTEAMDMIHAIGEEVSCTRHSRSATCSSSISTSRITDARSSPTMPLPARAACCCACGWPGGSRACCRTATRSNGATRARAHCVVARWSAARRCWPPEPGVAEIDPSAPAPS
jgi:hypothetical protein